jgi:hypothetical protein
MPGRGAGGYWCFREITHKNLNGISLMKKMKGLLLFFLFVLSACMTQQPITKEEGTVSETVETPGINAADIYTKINLWFVEAFNSAESVIQYSDKEQGVIKGKGNFATTFMTPIRVFFTITVEIKDEKYRLSFSDPYFQNTTTTNMSPTINTYPLDKRLLEETLAEWKLLANSLKKFLLSNKADW